jgi:uncharacterized cupin superfamily protein
VAEEPQRKYLVRAGEISEQAVTASHPWNPNSEFTGTRLAVLSGLTRVGVSLMKVSPGKESTPTTKISSTSWAGRTWT